MRSEQARRVFGTLTALNGHTGRGSAQIASTARRASWVGTPLLDLGLPDSVRTVMSRS